MKHQDIATPQFCLLQKSDKSRWCLVHDLRAVNDVVQGWPADVPNPHTLLTNVPPEARYFTATELYSAFGVTLAEESRHLFAFIYAGKRYTYQNASRF